MTNRPIIFSGPMVRALLDGRKTQTRRLSSSPLAKCVSGDRLYVREEWSSHAAFDGIPPRDLKTGSMIYTRADALWHNAGDWIGAPFGKRRPGMHMPRWASRLTLTVTDVRVQRLQEISEADAIAEGIEDVTAEVASSDPSHRFWRRYRDGGWNGYVDCSIGSYASLWTELHGPGAWEDNPWIVALTFTVERRNIDEVAVCDAADASQTTAPALTSSAASTPIGGENLA